MANRTGKFVRAGILAAMAALLYFASPTPGCGPFFPQAIFTNAWNPDLPFGHFAGGQMGILQPTFARTYLVIAYRYISAVGMPAAAREQTLAIWNRNVTPEDYDAASAAASTPAKNWLATRAPFAGDAAPAYLVEAAHDQWWGKDSPWRYFDYTNCMADAFRTASETLTARAKAWGATDASTKNWLAGQDAVFGNCRSMEAWVTPPKTAPPLPAAAPRNAPALLQSDRAYQIAAANFYAGNYAGALKQFDAIARDANSPWQKIANLVAARVCIRESIPSDQSKPLNKEPLAEASKRLRAIVDNPQLASLHDDAEGLLGFVDARLEPDVRESQLAGQLSVATPPADFKQALHDYTWLMDRTTGDLNEEMNVASLSKFRAENYKKQLATANGADLSDWLVTFQSPSPDAKAHALEQWQQKQSAAWLIASISKADGKDASAAALMSAALDLPANSPAYLTATFHRLRLQDERGDRDAVEDELAALLAKPEVQANFSARNALLAFRMRLAGNLDGALFSALRAPAVVTYGDPLADAGAPARDFSKNMLDVDGAWMFTRALPLSLLADVSRNDKLPEALRRQVAQAAWVRAVVLNDDQTLRDLLPAVEQLSPELKDSLEMVNAGATPEDRRFRATLTILRFPGLRPYVRAGVERQEPVGKMDDYRDNWWCALAAGPQSGEWNYRSGRSADSRAPASLLDAQTEAATNFLSAAEKEQAQAQSAQLDASPGGTTFLARGVLDWANSHADDPLVPEALHRVVQATHLGCESSDTDKSLSQVSRQAFDLLHQRYPASPWTKKTSVWY